MITSDQYKKANLAGLQHSDGSNHWCYYTPTLQVAYNLGLSGISIQNAEEVNAFRYGAAPNNFISYNYAKNEPEKGLSVYTALNIVRSEFSGRQVYYYTGLNVGTGGDGEMLILAFDADYLD